MDWKPFIYLTLGFAGGLLGLWLLNFPRRERHRQFWSPLATLVLAIAVLTVFHYVYQPADHFLKQVTLLIEALLRGQPATFSAGQQPSDPTSFPLFFNLIVLATFLLLKAGVHLPMRFVLWLRRRSDAATARPRFAYEKDPERGILLKPEWVFPGLLARYLAVLAFLLLAACLMVVTDPLWEMVSLPAFPLYGLPILPVLLFLETGWYLNGLRPWAPPGSLTFISPDAQRKGSYERLWEEYQTLWPEHVLAASAQLGRPSEAAAPLFAPGTATKGSRQAEVETVWKSLSARKDITYLDETYHELLERLWGEEDILLEDALYDRIAPMLFAALQRDLLNGHHILILVESKVLLGSQANQTSPQGEKVKDWVTTWLRSLYGEGAKWSIAVFQEFRGRREKPHLLIASAEEILSKNVLVNERTEEGLWFKTLKTVLILDAAPAVFGHIMPSSALLRALRDKLAPHQGEDLRFRSIILADNRVALETSMRRNLPVQPQEFRLPTDIPPQAFAILWRAEGAWFQQQLFARAGGYHIGDEPVLALLAWREGIEPIRLVEQAQLPVHEFVEALDKNKTQLRGHAAVPLAQLRGSAHHALKRDFEVSWLVAPLDRSFVLVRDHEYNAASALRRWLPLGVNDTFVHVVCPPYLLRDYLADNIDFFLHLGNPQIARSPRTMDKTRFTTAYALLERLVCTLLPVRTIKTALHEIDLGTQPVEEALQTLFLEVFQIDLLQNNYLRWKQQTVYQDAENRFEKITLFWLSPEIKDDARLQWLHQYEVHDSAGHILDTIPFDHLYQTYLPGQQHAFEGKSYEIDTVDHGAKYLKVDHKEQWGDHAGYRPRLEMHLSALRVLRAADPERHLNASWLVSAKLKEAALTIHTDGYYTFGHEGIVLRDGGYTFKELKGQDQIPVRHYEAARLFRLSFTPRRDDARLAVAKPSQLAFTLAVLFNEAFPTLFPETHAFILAATPMATLPEPRLARVMPHLYLEADLPEPEELVLYFIEDSHADLGLVQCLFDEWGEILEILRDYLYWLLEDDALGEQATWRKHIDDKTTFLRYGLEDVPDLLDLQGTLAFLRTLLPVNPEDLHERRLQYYSELEQAPATSTAETPSGLVCDFCSAPLSSTEYEELGDGRLRCERCRATATDSEEALEQVYEEARRYLRRTLKLTLRDNVHVAFANTTDIQAAMGTTFMPTAGYDPRAIGVAVRKGDHFSILVENGQPHHMTLGTTVHELTHIWQYDNLDYARMHQDHGLLLIEGHAMWTELTCLGEHHLAQEYIEQERAREDVYGEGYRHIVQLLHDNPQYATPFELLLDRYPVP